jgi:hypothetical protein
MVGRNLIILHNLLDFLNYFCLILLAGFCLNKVSLNPIPQGWRYGYFIWVSVIDLYP